MGENSFEVIPKSLLTVYGQINVPQFHCNLLNHNLVSYIRVTTLRSRQNSLFFKGGGGSTSCLVAGKKRKKVRLSTPVWNLQFFYAAKFPKSKYMYFRERLTHVENLVFCVGKMLVKFIALLRDDKLEYSSESCSCLPAFLLVLRALLHLCLKYFPESSYKKMNQHFQRETSFVRKFHDTTQL